MDDAAAIQEIAKLVVETHRELESLRRALGQSPLTHDEMIEAGQVGALDPDGLSPDLNEKLVASLREMLEELVAMKASRVLVKR